MTAAGATMAEVVESIRRVNDLVAEISAASTEQSQGVSQVGEAVGQMDHVTQQNAALVEESAAAAESLKAQARQLVQAVAVFKLAQGVQKHAAAQTTHAGEPAGSHGLAERRGPNRAKNVARPVFGAHTKPQRVSPTPTAEAAPTKTGTGGEWASF